jgi:hypothetical protein
VATHEFAGGQVRLEAPASVEVRERSMVAPRDLGAGRAVPPAQLAAQLERSGFEVLAQLDVEPTRGLGAGPAPGPEPVTFDVTVAPNQASVVLTEHDGLWSWQLPTPEVGAAATARVAVRALPGAALVLRFAAPLIDGLAIKFLERDVEEGLVHVATADPATWTPINTVGELHLPVGARILLLIHGTFSSTVGAYSPLGDVAGPGRAFLDRALETYDAIVGFDHRTLSVDPTANAEDLFHRVCAPAPADATVDVLTHSRGGLVARALVEKVLPGTQWGGAVDRIVYVGVPHAGTNFAEPDRWPAFVDVYTNLLMAVAPAAAVLNPALKAVGALVKYLVAYSVTGGGVPGLAAMEPGGRYLDDLNNHQVGQPESGPAWFAVTSELHVTGAAPGEFPRALALWLAEGTLDDLLDGANDLVVDTASMRAIDEAPSEFLRDSLDFGANPAVHHLNYFTQVEVSAGLQSWLVDRSDSWRGPQAAMAGLEGLGADVDLGPEDLVEAHVRAEMPSKIRVDEPLKIRVLLARNEIDLSADTITATDTPFGMHARETLTVELKPRRNVTVDGSGTDAIGLPAGSGVSVVEFEVVASAAGRIELTVLLRRRSGEIVANLTLRGEARHPDDPDRRRSMIRRQVMAAAESSVTLEESVWLEVWPVDGPGYLQFQYDLRFPGPTPNLRFESPKLRNHEAFVAELFDAIEQAWTLNSDNPARFRKFLQTRGSDLFERLFPEEMQAKLWELRDDLKSVLLLADEPYFPWEIIHLKPPVGPGESAPRFLAQYGLLRWQFLPFPQRPELRARPGKVYSLCPRKVDRSFLLLESIAEAEFLAKELKATDLRASTTAVRRLLKRGDFDVLHFSGHGKADTTDIAEALIMLDDRKVEGNLVRQFLSATEVAESASLTSPDGAGPLVVLNACQAGRGGVQLSSMGGFARAFLAAGAQAFVACLWSVAEQPSRIFTENLYRQLIDGRPLGQAVLHARESARAEEDAATWLAYVVYGRPDAKLILQ